MKFNYLILFLLVSTLTRAQQIHLQGKVIDVHTGLAVPAVTLSITAKNLNFATDSNGKFDIQNDKIKKTDTIIFSCTGYQTQYINVVYLSRNITIALLPAINMYVQVKVKAIVPEIHFVARIIDAQTNRPIPNTYVSIKLSPNSYYSQSDNSDKRFYYKADTAGEVNINADKLPVASDTITISCFNYQTQFLKSKDVPANHIIKLVPIVKPIKYEDDHSELISVGSKKKTSKYYSAMVNPGYEQAMFMHGSQDINGIIQTVGFYLCDGRGYTKGDATAPFRIRLFKIDTAAGPGDELTKDIIITSAKKSDAWYDVDISAYNIESPCDGFYVAISYLDSGYYKIKKGATTVDFARQPLEYGANPPDIMMPRLAHTLDEFEMARSYISINRSLQNWTRHWIHDYWNYSYMIRATILAPK